MSVRGLTERKTSSSAAVVSMQRLAGDDADRFGHQPGKDRLASDIARLKPPEFVERSFEVAHAG